MIHRFEYYRLNRNLPSEGQETELVTRPEFSCSASSFPKLNNYVLVSGTLPVVAKPLEVPLQNGFFL